MSPPAARAPSPRYYPLFGLGANVALVFSGQFVRYVSGLRRTWAAAGCTFDPWGASLKYLMGGVVVSGSAVRRGPLARLTALPTACVTAASRLLAAPSDARPLQVLGINHYLTTRVMTDPTASTGTAQKKAKTKMGFKESAQFLASSK